MAQHFDYLDVFYEYFPFEEKYPKNNIRQVRTYLV